MRWRFFGYLLVPSPSKGQACSAFRSVSGFARHAYGFKPAADVDLSVGFAAKMPRGGAGGGSQIPLDDGKLQISALDHKPVIRILTDDPANLALEFLETRHAFSVEL